MTASSAPQLAALGKGAYAYIQPDGSWGLNNAGFLTSGDGTLLIDTAMTVARAQALRAAVEHASASAHVRTVVNTHHHPDHTFGNCVFPEATIVANEHCREHAVAVGLMPLTIPGIDYGDVVLRPPNVTFAQDARSYVGDEPVEFLSVGVAHTPGDLVVWLPERKLMYVGDIVFANATPFVMDGSIRQSLLVLERLKALAPEVVVSGHGPLRDAGCFDETADYLRFVQDAAREPFARGVPAFEAARKLDLGHFTALPDRERIVGNMYRAYSELQGEPDGSSILPPFRLFNEMSEYLGKPIVWNLQLS